MGKAIAFHNGKGSSSFILGKELPVQEKEVLFRWQIFEVGILTLKATDRLWSLYVNYYKPNEIFMFIF